MGPYYGWFYRLVSEFHHFFYSKVLSSSKRSVTILKMVVDFQGSYKWRCLTPIYKWPKINDINGFHWGDFTLTYRSYFTSFITGRGGPTFFSGGTRIRSIRLESLFSCRTFDKTLNPSEVDTSGGKKNFFPFFRKILF